jgi:hypothetical protein
MSRPKNRLVSSITTGQAGRGAYNPSHGSRPIRIDDVPEYCYGFKGRIAKDIVIGCQIVSEVGINVTRTQV